MVNRFELVKCENLTLDTSPVKRVGMEIKIIRDRKTGILYVCTEHGGITPMLDDKGRLVVDLE